jgi:hypothetical protein
LFLHFDDADRTPVAATRKRRRRGPTITVEVLGEVPSGSSIFVLWRKGTQVVIGASLTHEQLEPTLARLRTVNESYAIINVPVFDIG